MRAKRKEERRTLPGERNILMSMLRRLGGGREACSQSTDHL